MKKGEVYQGITERIDFPNKGHVRLENGETIIVKNALPGQSIMTRICKKRSGNCEGSLLEVLSDEAKDAKQVCPYAGVCGGCLYQNRAYETSKNIKGEQIHRLLDAACKANEASSQYTFEGVLASPVSTGYRNKMEFSFGDFMKGGELELGLHKRNSMYDIISVSECMLISEGMQKVLVKTLEFFRGKQAPFYHKMRHEGYLRHLLLRQSASTKELMVVLVTSSQLDWMGEDHDEEWYTKMQQEMLADYSREIQSIAFEEASIGGILHMQNDSLADVVKSDLTTLLYGKDYIEEELLGLRFKITPFSFFQTNSKGAEVLYSKVREYVNEVSVEGDDRVVFDLYSGTGTIAQIIAPSVKGQVIGVEIVEEAVEAAKENAKENGLSDNCSFIAGDVLKVLDEIEKKPDFIILDPPRDGIHPKALPKILSYGVDYIVYISCKPTSLVRDLVMFHEYGYHMVKACAADIFPYTANVETIALLSRETRRPAKDYVKVGIDAEEYYAIKNASRD